MIRFGKNNIKYYLAALIIFTAQHVFFSSSYAQARSRISSQLLQDTLLSDGVVYKNLRVSINRQTHNVHILQADLSSGECDIKVMKAMSNISELAKLQDIVKYYDSLETVNIVGAINANFWRAYTNYPIGPVIIDGEIIEKASYKQWSSLFVNEFGAPFIDNFKLSGYLLKKNTQEFSIDYVNRRRDTTGIVLYNKYGGKVIPHVNSKKISEIISTNIDNFESEEEFNDSTEVEFDVEQLKAELLEMERSSSIEYGLFKIAIDYINLPGINKNLYGIVRQIDSLSMEMPANGCIISFGKDFISEYLPNLGDTVLIRFDSNVHKNEVFVSAVCGTPRLVRKGIASHEARTEGSTGRRFINHKLPRTAVGYTQKKDKFLLVTVRATSRSEGIQGANLEDMAEIMKYLGCYDAMNLDGGGSTVMVIDGVNAMLKDHPNSSRRVSVGLGIISGNSFRKFLQGLDY